MASDNRVSDWFDRFGLMCAVVFMLLCMVVPMVVISMYTQQGGAGGGAGGEAAVGIAAILRFAARRLLRVGAGSMLSTTLGAVSRTTARTMIRRLVRVALKTMLAAKTKEWRAAQSGADGADDGTPAQQAWVAVSLGALALYLSLWFILAQVLSPEVRQLILHDIAPEVAAALGALPLVVYAVSAYLAGRLFGVQVQYVTGIDGLLLQAYFTGAGSFLPLTTDTHYAGPDAAVRRLAMSILLGNLVLFGVLALAAHLTGSYPLEFFASITLIYLFVFAFPIRPLDGHYLWQHSKLLWLAVFVPVLLAFFAYIPEALNDIL